MNSGHGKVTGIVPAYKPDRKLLETLKAAASFDFLPHIVVVDDGSGDEYKSVFEECAGLNGVDVIHLGVNGGAGAATKAGIQYALFRYPESMGYVTFDADGQHHPEDVKKVVEAFFSSHAAKFVIGTRNFHDPSLNIPFRSRFGNRITEFVFYLFTGIHISDTQSGLRCFSVETAKKLTQILRNRYDFLLEALLLACESTDCVQVPVQTIYEDRNERSHFNPVTDSIRIYTVFFRFSVSSAVCSVVDYILFSAMYLCSKQILASLVLSRIVSVTLNFVLNKQKVFEIRENTFKQFCEFCVLALLLLAGSCYGISFLKDHCGWSPFFSKIPVEILLFFFSFLVQRLVIFVRRTKDGIQYTDIPHLFKKE